MSIFQRWAIFVGQVARTGGGYATVVVTRPDGLRRGIDFRMGEVIGVDTSEAEGYHDFSAVKKGDLFKIRVGPDVTRFPVQ